jgi:transposase-like protein
MLTNLDKLRLLGEALHGPRWQNAVARDLDVNPRQVHRWVSGEYEPHEGHVADLIRLAQRRSAKIAEAIESTS